MTGTGGGYPTGSMKKHYSVACLLAVVGAFSCGGEGPPPFVKFQAKSKAGANEAQAVDAKSSAKAGHGVPRGEAAATASAPAAISGEKSDPAGEAVEAEAIRKIVKTGEFNVTVKEMDGPLEALSRKLEGLGGFLSDTNVYRNPGSPPHARIVLKIPERSFGPAVEHIRSMGEVTFERVWTEDVTDQFYDLEARIGNQRRTEQRMLQILERQTGKLHEVLEVEREISRVRETLERFQGQMKVLSTRIDLSTITLNVQTKEDYRPKKESSFGEKVSDMFRSSAGALVKFLTAIVFIVVAIVPWLSIPAALLVFVFVLKAIFLRKRKD
ncbi:MAG: DUF4349 domain-containing protein [Deltaproteobacteria bacterium]|nr:DUF4349 domain-containing protein [Deltaproteobacteria bacterium]